MTLQDGSTLYRATMHTSLCAQNMTSCAVTATRSLECYLKKLFAYVNIKRIVLPYQTLTIYTFHNVYIFYRGNICLLLSNNVALMYSVTSPSFLLVLLHYTFVFNFMIFFITKCIQLGLIQQVLLSVITNMNP